MAWYEAADTQKTEAHADTYTDQHDQCNNIALRDLLHGYTLWLDNKIISWSARVISFR